MLQVVVDLCRSKNIEMVSPTQFHDWTALYRMLFGLDAILQEDAIEKTLSKTPQLFVPSMRLMNRAFEDGGKHTFSTVPLTWKFRPGFVTFDRITCAEVLKIPLAMQKCRLAKEFVVANVPEHYTSQTCLKCFGKCGPFHGLKVLQRSSVAQKKKKNVPPKKKKRTMHAPNRK